MELPAGLHGDCDPAYAQVAEAFTANFAERGEVGAAVCVVRRGEVVVDLWGGSADAAGTRPWESDTVVNHYSVGKAILAVLVLRLVDAGTLTLDTPVADVWPEFAAGGKHAVTVADALCHRGTVPAIRELLDDADLADWDRMTGALAATEPWWPPGARHAYHTNTYGHLVGEIVHRATGRMPRDVLADLVAGVAGHPGAPVTDVTIGLPESSWSRCADVIWAPAHPLPARIDFAGLSGDLLLNALAHFNPPGYSSVGVVDTPPWRTSQVPSTNGHSTARGLAAFYAALLEPGWVVSPELLASATRAHSVGPCPILGEDAVFGLGFTPTTERRPLGPNPRAFGHFGTGGALGFADPDSGVAFGYVMNHVIPRWQSTRNRALIDAVFAAP